MGRVATFGWMAWLLCMPFGAARAADAVLIQPEGTLIAGTDVDLVLVTTEGHLAHQTGPPIISASVGEIVRDPAPAGKGRWAMTYRVPADVQGSVAFRVEVDDAVFVSTIMKGPVRFTPVTLPPSVYGQAGQKKPVRIELNLGQSKKPTTLDVTSVEGRPVEIVQTSNGRFLEWKPGPDPFPRAIPIGVRDSTSPVARPVWTTAMLVAKPKIPIRTEPGASVVLSVRDRTYGPFTADEKGLVNARVDVRPGESLAELLVTDRAGNKQTSSLALGGDSLPGLNAIASGRLEVGKPLPDIFLRGVKPNGSPWSGVDPACTSSLGEIARIEPIGRGEWRAMFSDTVAAAGFGARVDCQLDHRARVSLRLDTDVGKPEDLVLRVYPSEVLAEMPEATVEVFLKNARSEGMPAAGITLQAEHGQLTLSGDGGLEGIIRSNYNGTNAVPLGGDHIRASWMPLPGTGVPWRMITGANWNTDAPMSGAVYGRALNQEGDPLVDVPVEFGTAKGQVQVNTNDAGWAKCSIADLGLEPGQIITMRAGDVVRQMVVFPGDIVGPNPDKPDLSAVVEVPIRTGRIQEVFLSTDPRTLVTGRDSFARVTVRLVDKHGSPVTDADIQFETSEGDITEPKKRSDGSFDAYYSAPNTKVASVSRITVFSATEQFVATSTELEIIPQPIGAMVGMGVGYLGGRNGLQSSFLEVSGQLNLMRFSANRFTRSDTHKPALLFARVALGRYGETASTTDSTTGETLSLVFDVMPIHLGLLTRKERGLAIGWLGGNVVFAPYHLSVNFGEMTSINGFSMSTPGAAFLTGVGRRVQRGEVGLELEALFLTIDSVDVGWDGQAGGITGKLVYQLVF